MFHENLQSWVLEESLTYLYICLGRTCDTQSWYIATLLCQPPALLTADWWFHDLKSDDNTGWGSSSNRDEPTPLILRLDIWPAADLTNINVLEVCWHISQTEPRNLATDVAAQRGSRCLLFGYHPKLKDNPGSRL